MPLPPDPPTLTTDRLIVRPANPLSSSDCDLLIKTYNDPFIGPWGFNRAHIHTQEDIIRKHRISGPSKLPDVCTRWMNDYGEVRWDVEFHLVFLKKPDRSAGAYMGFVGMNFREEVGFPDYGYAFFQQYNGKGYASEASKVVLDWWKNEVGVEKIWLFTGEDNFKSQACALRCGFVEGGKAKRIGTEDDGSESVSWGRGYLLPSMTWPAEGIVLRPPRIGQVQQAGGSGNS